jgi:transposase
MARHRRFNFELKRQVVLDVLEERVGLREVARKHCISRSLIRQWIQKYESGQLTDELDEVRIAEYEGKIAELERKVGQLTMENDLLKKGARWARRPNDDTISSNSIVQPRVPAPPGGRPWACAPIPADNHDNGRGVCRCAGVDGSRFRPYRPGADPQPRCRRLL